jgi:hypothetical protein
MVSEITVQRFEVRVGALAGHEPQLHELAGGVVDEHQQGARIAALLKPAMVTPIDLNQFAVTLAPQSRLVERPSLTRSKLDRECDGMLATRSPPPSQCGRLTNMNEFTHDFRRSAAGTFVRDLSAVNDVKTQISGI